MSATHLPTDKKSAELVPTNLTEDSGHNLSENSPLPSDTKEVDISPNGSIPSSPIPEERKGSASIPGKVSPLQDGQLADTAHDLELGRVQSGPAYSAFSRRMKVFIVFMVSWGGFFSPLTASIYFPALNALAKDFHTTNTRINLTLTTYMIFQGLAPTLYGDLADIGGRRPAYLVGFVVYIVANIGLALQNNYVALVLLRCLQSSGSSGMIALANGVIGDIATSSERGSYIGWAVSGPMTGPALGPVLGGILSQFLGWRAIFWFLTIMSLVFIVPFLVTFPETGRNVVGNGSIPPQGWNMSLINYLAARKAEEDDSPLSRSVSNQEIRAAQAKLASQRKLRWPNPLSTVHIILEKDVGTILVVNALISAAFYDIMASLPSLFAEIYRYNDLQIGLCFIPFGVGAAVSSVSFGKTMDWNYKRIAKKAGISVDRNRGEDMKDFPIEKARIQLIWIPLYIGVVATLCYGWALEKNSPLAAPLVLLFIIGLTWTGTFNVLSTMLVDLYPQQSATATAANNLCRCLTGAAGTAIIIQMIDAMGRGWCFTFIALVVMLCSPLLWVIERWGPKWREERRVRIQKRKEEKTGKESIAEGKAG
ncbi:hypothetical protein MMC06_006435 [Schaereria dolodes]|nr:hypothetical protein [Schaereria dolodes]